MTIESPMFGIRRAPADHDTQAYLLGTCWDIFWFNIFFMGGILWVYQTQGLFIICVPDTDVTENSHSDCSWTAAHQKKNKLIKF